MKLVIVCALARESLALRSAAGEVPIWSIGLGAERAKKSLIENFKNFQPSHLLFVGYCGSISPQFTVGDLTVVDQIKIKMTSVAQPVETVEQKVFLAQQTGAHLVDMEGQAVQSFCVEHGIHLVMAKVVIDDLTTASANFNDNKKHLRDNMKKADQVLSANLPTLISQLVGQ